MPEDHETPLANLGVGRVGAQLAAGRGSWEAAAFRLSSGNKVRP